MKQKLLKVLAYSLGTIGLVASSAASVGCILLSFDEPTMPNKMIEK